MALETLFHVLVVDDSLINRKLIEKLFKTSYFQGILIRILIDLFFSSDLYFGVFVTYFFREGVFFFQLLL